MVGRILHRLHSRGQLQFKDFKILIQLIVLRLVGAAVMIWLIVRLVGAAVFQLTDHSFIHESNDSSLNVV